MAEYDERSAIRQSYEGEAGAGGEGYPQGKPRGLLQKIPKRYIVAFLSFLGFMNIYILRVNLSIAIVAMTRNQTAEINIYNNNIHNNSRLVVITNNINNNGSITPTEPNSTIVVAKEFDWDSKLQGVILSSFFWGYILTQLPGGWMASQIGGKYLFGGGVLGTAILTILSPIAARASPVLFIIVRLVEGLFEGVTYPAIHAVWAKWAPPLERSKLATTAFSGAYFGIVVAMPMSGSIIASLGWPSVFYITGLIGLLWVAIWMYFVVESPNEHKTISMTELDYINRSIGYVEQTNLGMNIPWRSILCSGPVWAVAIAHLAENWGFYTLLTELPSFLRDVTNFSLTQSGFAAALPYLTMAIMVYIGGHIADVIRSRGILSTTVTRKTFTAGAFLWQMAFMLITAYMTNPGSVIATISVAVGVGGFAWAGFSVNHLDLAPQYASVLMGVSNTLATLPGIASPSLTGFLTQHHTILEWRVVFFIAATVYCVGALFYVLLASGERQSWAQVPEGYDQHLDDQSELDRED